MEIRNHRIDDIWFRQSSNIGGAITPSVLVTHYTTGWSGAGSRDWLLGASAGMNNPVTSAHVVIDRDGTAWQIVPFNRKAIHAGPSRYGTLNGINSHGIGLEFVNPGWLKPAGDGRWADGYGNRRSNEDLEAFGGFGRAPHSRVGGDIYAWPLFTPAQIETGRQIAAAIFRKYDIRAVVSHEEIDTRGWKTDPGPAFPQQLFVDLLEGGSDFAGRPESGRDVFVTNATRLNLRGGPGTQNERIDPPGHLPFGTRVKIIRRDGDWAYAEVSQPGAALPGLAPGLRGWVHAGYLDLDLG